MEINGFCVVEEFIGYGVGRNLYEEFAVFNCWILNLFNVKFRVGMILVIEFIVNVGLRFIKILFDRWIVVIFDNFFFV